MSSTSIASTVIMYRGNTTVIAIIQHPCRHHRCWLWIIELSLFAAQQPCVVILQCCICYFHLFVMWLSVSHSPANLIASQQFAYCHFYFICLSVSHTVALLPYHYPTYWTCVSGLMFGSFGGSFRWGGRGSTFTLKIPLPLQVGAGTPSCSQLCFLCHWKNNWWRMTMTNAHHILAIILNSQNQS